MTCPRTHSPPTAGPGFKAESLTSIVWALVTVSTPGLTSFCLSECQAVINIQLPHSFHRITRKHQHRSRPCCLFVCSDSPSRCLPSVGPLVPNPSVPPTHSVQGLPILDSAFFHSHTLFLWSHLLTPNLWFCGLQHDFSSQTPPDLVFILIFLEFRSSLFCRLRFGPCLWTSSPSACEE